MNKTSRTIAKNASVLMASQLITWALALLLTIFLPRYLGVEAIGRLHLANSLWAIMMIFITFGMDILLTKEIARTPERTSEFLANTTVLRIGIYLIGFGVMAIYARIANYPPETILVIYIIGISSLAGVITGGVQSALQGLERMEFMSIADIIAKAFVTVVAIILLLMGYNVVAIAIVVVFGATISLVIQAYALNRLQPLKFKFDLNVMKWMLAAGFPFLIMYSFLTIYQQVDIVIISILVDEKGVGWYGAADRLFGTLLFAPGVFISAIFPALSRMHASGSGNIRNLIGKSFDLMMLMCVPIGLGLATVAQPFVVLLYGPDFAKSGPILSIMGIVLIMTYLNILLGYLLISTDRQNAWTVVMAVATLATIPLDLLLVPWCERMFGNGAMGGALAFVVTEGGMLAIGLWLIPRGNLGRSNAVRAVKVLLAGFIMVAVTWWLRDKFILLPIILGAVSYVAAIVLLRVIPHEDWVLFQELSRSLLNRFKDRSAQPAGLGGGGN